MAKVTKKMINPFIAGMPIIENKITEISA